jgi:hypothetical protein
VTEQDQASAEAELREFLDGLPAAAQELILDVGTIGYLRELHRRITDFERTIDVLAKHSGVTVTVNVSGRMLARARLFELLPPLG